MNGRRRPNVFPGRSPDTPGPSAGYGAAYGEGVAPFLMAVIPSVGGLFLFWLAIRAILEADRRERSAQARIEAAERSGNAPEGSDGPAPG